VEEKGGKWGIIHLLKRAFVMLQFKPTQFPNPYHIKTYLSNQYISKYGQYLSQYLISKCYNFAQKCFKMITKSYKIYGKYLKKFEKLSGIFWKGFLIFFWELFIIPIGISGIVLNTLGFFDPFRNVYLYC